MASSIQVTFDCADPDLLAAFWASVLRYSREGPPSGYANWPDFLTAQGVPKEQWNAASAIFDPAGGGPRIYFQRVPETKTIKNRVHLDVTVSGGRYAEPAEQHRLIDAEAERLLKMGAARLPSPNVHGAYWVVMADPEGNEFCLQ